MQPQTMSIAYAKDMCRIYGKRIKMKLKKIIIQRNKGKFNSSACQNLIRKITHLR